MGGHPAWAVVGGAGMPPLPDGPTVECASAGRAAGEARVYGHRRHGDRRFH